MAECQKSADVKHILTLPTLSAKSERGYFLEKKDVSIYKPSSCKNGTPPMAERVEFLEKNHNFGQKPRALAEGVGKNSGGFCDMLLTLATGD